MTPATAYWSVISDRNGNVRVFIDRRLGRKERAAIQAEAGARFKVQPESVVVLDGVRRQALTSARGVERRGDLDSVICP